MTKLLFIALGTLSLGLAVLGVILPGLPATPFLLLSAGCYVKSSEKMYNWLINHRLLGKYLTSFRKNRAMPWRAKVLSLVSMWTMIGISVFLLRHNPLFIYGLPALGLVGTVSILLFPTLKHPNPGERGEEKTRP